MIRRPLSTAFLDLLFQLVILLFMMVNIPGKEADSRPRSEFTLSMEWTNNKRKADMDIYVLLPTGQVCWFRSKDRGSVFIDIDHLGGPTDPPVRREDVNWTAPIIPGSYFVSVHNFRGSTINEVLVTLTLYDKTGKVRWHTSVPAPPVGAETPVVEFVFSGEGQLVSIRPSNKSIARLGQ